MCSSDLGDAFILCCIKYSITISANIFLKPYVNLLCFL